MRFLAQLLILGALLAMSPLVMATDELEPDVPSAFENCRDLSYIGREVMQYRQKDRPMSEALVRATGRLQEWSRQFSEKTGNEMTRQEAEEMAAPLVMAAYEVTISTVPYQPEAITAFENTVFQECYIKWTSEPEG